MLNNVTVVKDKMTYSIMWDIMLQLQTKVAITRYKVTIVKNKVTIWNHNVTSWNIVTITLNKVTIVKHKGTLWETYYDYKKENAQVGNVKSHWEI